MTDVGAESDTDREWEKWGQQDPYFAVLTHERFRSAQLTPEAKDEFFMTGRYDVGVMLEQCRRWIDPSFAPGRVLDFGCGVGRLIVPLAESCQSVVGVDVSPAMLAEARRNCDERSLSNVELRLSDDRISALDGVPPFDLVHSSIVFQHIGVARGRELFRRLIGHLAPGGVAAIQLTYGKSYHPDSYGQPTPAPAEPLPLPPPLRPDPSHLVWGMLKGIFDGRPGRHRDRTRVAAAPPARELADAEPAAPEMLMNAYPLSEVAYIMQNAGVQSFHASFTDHGGELGVFLYFQRGAA